MSKPRLILATSDQNLRDAFLDMNEEFRQTGGNQFREGIGVETYGQFLKKLKGDEELDDPTGPYVPQSVYWLVGDTGRVLGEIRLRHFLNENLKEEGGHIGYHLRPSERGKGYGTLILRLLLDEIRNRFDRVLVTCDTDNIPSAKVIERNGGVFDSHGISKHSGKQISRYWIELK